MFELDWFYELGLVGMLGLSLWVTAAAGEIVPTDKEAQQP